MGKNKLRISKARDIGAGEAKMPRTVIYIVITMKTLM